MTESNIRALVHRDDYSEGFKFLLEDISFGKNPRRVVTALTFEERKAGTYLQPSFTLDEEQAQALFNAMWLAGLRPKDGTGNSGHVEALNNHLQDMRKLVFERKTNGTT